MSLSISAAHRAARNQASIDLASAGSGPASIRFYTAQGGTLLGQRTLASPCAALTPEGRIQLLPGADADLVAASGSIGWAAWCDGDGVAIASGAVTDANGAGPFRLQGAQGTQVYAGGMVLLALPALLG